MSNPTMRDIGKVVGISAVTVSKALAGKPGVSEKMRQKIIQVAQEMNYVSPAASKENAHLDVGILIPESYFSTDSFYSMLYKLLVRCLQDAGHYGILEMLDESFEENLILPNLIRNSRVDALIILGEPSKDYLRAVCKQTIPIVFLDFYDEQASADSIVGDNVYGCYRLTSHLIKSGHTDIGFVGSIRSTSSIMDRYLGYYKAMLSHNLSIREDCIIQDRINHKVAPTFVLPQKLPTAFVCNCDLVAKRLMHQLAAAGIRVPEDVSVVGFDDYSEDELIEPSLSTFCIDTEAMAQAAVKTVQDRVSGTATKVSRMVITGSPIYRNSSTSINK
ncbi:MAG: LacI family transcriptional regulator [Clostridiales bacterium]|nr:LacI family transcriptional regulator [Clostridiales bacterium]